MADEALQVRRSHATESAMLILATLFFIFCSYLTISEVDAHYVRSTSDWEIKRGAALGAAEEFIEELEEERSQDGLESPREE